MYKREVTKLETQLLKLKKEREKAKKTGGRMMSGLILNALMNARNNETQLRWHGSVFVFTLNLPALYWVLTKLLGKFPITVQDAMLFLIMSLGVCALNVIWYHILRRDNRFIAFWNDKLIELENKNGTQGDIDIFTSERYARITASRGRVQHRLELVTYAIIIIWFMVVVGFVTILLT